jgi:biotin carboxyl carrier protein
MNRKLRITVEGKAYDVAVEILDDNTAQSRPAATAPVATAEAAAPAPVAAATQAPVSAGNSSDITSPLAGKVVSVQVKVGDTVKEGQQVMTLEAMKMNTLVHATTNGTVKSINIVVGAAVEEGQSLMSIG